MKFINYLLQYTFILLFTYVVLFQFGPSLIKKGIKKENIDYLPVNIQQISLDYLNQSTTSYLALDIILNNQSYRLVFQANQNNHRGILDFFYENNYLQPGSIKYKLSTKDLPIAIFKDDLPKDIRASMILSESGVLDGLIINDKFVIGEKTGVITKVLAIVFGVISMIVVSILLLITLLILLKNLDIYKETGKIPDLPNSIDESIKGWKIILTKKKKL